MVKHLYLHVPFCKSICAYCDFCHWPYQITKVDEWLDELALEMNSYQINEELKTIYIGGGTPTSLNLQQLERLLSLIKPYSLNVEEYTIEVNPETIDEMKVDLLKKYGINRISMGLQAVQDDLLKMMNRHHNLNDVKKAIDIFHRKGIHNISLDLMYSLPHQSIDNFKESLEVACSLDVNHLSLYSLVVEDNTLFAKKGYQSLEDDIEADMYELAVSYLSSQGFEQYEISNFAKDKHYSSHNLAYWSYNDFYGISLGASGKIGDCRYDNTRNLKDYLNHQYRQNEIYLSLEDMMFEEIMMSFRTIFGLDLKRFEKRYKRSFFEVCKKPYEQHREDFIFSDNTLRVKNLELLNSLLVDFMD